MKKLGVFFLDPNEQGEPTQFSAVFVDGVDDAKLAYLEDMNQLEHILLQNTDVSDAGLVHLKRLTALKKSGSMRPGLEEDLFHDATVDIGQAEIAPRIAVGQSIVI